MKVGYRRVSTVDQNTARQLEGVTVDKVFEDKASGKDRSRPQLKAALEFCREGDTLVVHSMDRLARNLRDLLMMVEELTEKKVAVQFVKENLTFTGDDAPMSKLLLGVLGSCAEFERAMILERQREGIAIAKQEGKYKGRKRSLSPEQCEAAMARLQNGATVTEVAEELGISRQTLYEYKRNANAYLQTMGQPLLRG